MKAWHQAEKKRGNNFIIDVVSLAFGLTGEAHMGFRWPTVSGSSGWEM